ncbi:MAG: HdeD family acid-resistance protein [Acidobacteriota bacterium]
MIIVIARNWWALLIRGLAAIALALLTFLWPGITFYALVILFGAYALIDGVAAIVGVVKASERHERWGVLLLEGLAGIAAAAVTVLWPGITALALVYVIAAWAAVTGALEIAAAVRLRRYIAGEWLLALSGVVSIILAVLLAAAPGAGALAIALWFGIYALVLGVLEIALAFRLRTWSRRLAARQAGEAPIRRSAA